MLLELIPLPEGQPIKLRDGHAEDLVELFLGQVALQAGPVYILGQSVSPSCGHQQKFIRVDLVFSHAPVDRVHAVVVEEVCAGCPVQAISSVGRQGGRFGNKGI